MNQSVYNCMAPVQIPAAQANNGDNHAVSALKFRMLRHFLQLGYSVLLSDVVC